MKKQIKIFIASVILVFVGTAEAQITKAKPEEFKEVKSRPLIIELLEEDKGFIEDQKNKILKAKKEESKTELQTDIDKHVAFVKSFNESIKNAVQKYWDLNQTVEYKTKSEVESLKKAKSTKYTVLFYSESGTSVTNNGYIYRPGITLPTLNYSRIEKGMAKLDYTFFMPSTGSSDDEVMSESDFIISLKIMKSHIAEIEKSAKSGYTAKEYCIDQDKANCLKLEGITFYLDKSFIKTPEIEKEIMECCKNKVEFIESDKIVEIIKNEEDKVVTVNIPYGISAATTGGSVSISVARVQYMKSLVNAKTGEIYYVFGTSTGEYYDMYWRPKQIGKIGQCK